MHRSSLKQSSIETNDNCKFRYSLPLLPTTTQLSPVLLINSRNSHRQTFTDLDNTRHEQKKLLIDSQEQYEHTKQLLVMHDEIAFLTNRLIYTEQKLCKWKKMFLELQTGFQEILAEKDKVEEELKITHRMLQESEHIRARWFIKSTIFMPQVEQEVDDKRNTSFYRKSTSLPKSAIFRFLKFKSTSLSKTPAV